MPLAIPLLWRGGPPQVVGRVLQKPKFVFTPSTASRSPAPMGRNYRGAPTWGAGTAYCPHPVWLTFVRHPPLPGRGKTAVRLSICANPKHRRAKGGVVADEARAAGRTEVRTIGGRTVRVVEDPSGPRYRVIFTIGQVRNG